MEIFWIVIVAQAIICAGLSANLASHKGYSEATWMFCGLIFGIFGLIAAAGLPSINTEELDSDELKKECPQCAELIKIAAKICKYCKHEFTEAEVINELSLVLDNGSSSEVLEALDYLKNKHDNSIITHLISVFDTADARHPTYASKIQDKISKLILEIGDASFVPELLDIFKKGGSLTKKSLIISMLQKLRDPAAIPHIFGTLKITELHLQATQVLIDMGELAKPYLEKMIKEGKRSDRKIAEKILSKIM